MRAVALSFACWIGLTGGSAFASVDHAYVMQSGNDANLCTMAAPCKTVQRGIDQVQDGGPVTLLDDASLLEAIRITKSVTLEGRGRPTIKAGALVNNDDPAIVVDAPGIVVSIRNLRIGAPFALFSYAGVGVVAAKSVLIEDVVFDHVTGPGGIPACVLINTSSETSVHLRRVTAHDCGAASAGEAVRISLLGSGNKRVTIEDSALDTMPRGIAVSGSGNLQLSISNTTISNSAGDGVYVNPNGGTTRLVIQNSKVVNNGGTGLMIAPTGSAKVNTTIIGSGMDGNVIGIRSFPASPAVSNLSISDTSASNNAGGVHASGNSVVGIIRGNVSGNSSYGITAIAPAAIRIGSSMVNGNMLGLSGPVSSYGNNQLLGNTTQGSSTPVAPVAEP